MASLGILAMLGICVLSTQVHTASQTTRTAARMAVASLQSSDHIAAPEPVYPLAPPAPANPAEVRLGKALFHDKRLSGDDSVACASCHVIGEGGDDGRATSRGIKDRVGSLNAPSVLNAALNATQFWDGRADSLDEQLAEPIHNPDELGSSWAEVLRKLDADAGLVARFRHVYGERPSEAGVTRAIVTYERQLLTARAPFDRYLSGDADAISDAAKQGYQTFKQLGCVACHQGRGIGGNMFQRFGTSRSYIEDRGEVRPADLGRFNVTGRESDRYRFKVPSLRNVADTAPYFHDGSVSGLDEAIRLMASYQLGRPVAENQVRSIAAFLATLSGEIPEHLK